MKKQSATIFGSTGLVGQQLQEMIGQDEHFEKVYLANRRVVDTKYPKQESIKVDFDKLDQHLEIFTVDHIFICLGTTIKTAGSQAAFKAVDLEMPKGIAQLSKAQTILMISSLGADANSSNFYLRTKGQAEAAVQQATKAKVYFVRPSMLLGNRKEKRTGEAIAKFLMEKLEFLMFGPFQKYRGIYDVEVAKAMLQIAKTAPAQKIIESKELKVLANEYT